MTWGPPLPRSVAEARGGPIAVVAIGKAAEWVTLAAMLTIIPRVLGPRDYGTFGVALGLVTLGSAGFALGGPAVMARFVAAAPLEGRPALARALALSAVRWRASLLATCVAAVAALIVLDPVRFPPLTTTLVLAAVVIDAGATLAFQIALGLDRTMLWSMRYPVQNLCIVVASPLLYLAAGVPGALAGIATGSFVALVIGTAAIRTQLRGPVGTLPATVRRFAALQALSGLGVQLQHRGGVVAVAWLAIAQVEAGYATLAIGIAIAAVYAVWQVFTVALPRMSARAASDGGAADHELRRMASLLAVPSVLVALAVAAVAEPLLRLLAGGQFVPASGALVLAMAAVPFAPVTGAVAAASSLHLRPGARLGTALAGVAAFTVAVALWVPRHGALGASAALVLGSGAMAVSGALLFPSAVGRGTGAATVLAALAVAYLAVGR